MLRICISGLSCSGKTTLGHAIAKDLNIMHITKHGLDSYEKPKREGKFGLTEMAKKEHADLFDSEVVSLAESNDCVVTTWLGPWMIKDATARIWLSASFEARAARYAAQKNVGIEEAKAFIKQKDELTVNDFKETYKIDVRDHSFFDMMLNSERLSMQEEVSVISMLVLWKEKSRF